MFLESPENILYLGAKSLFTISAGSKKPNLNLTINGHDDTLRRHFKLLALKDITYGMVFFSVCTLEWFKVRFSDRKACSSQRHTGVQIDS